MDVNARTQIRISHISLPRQLWQLREMLRSQMLSETPPPPTRRGAIAPSPRDPPAGALRPAPRSARLPRAQVQLSLMALYLLPDASFCSFLRISSILTFAGGRPQTARGAHARPGGDAAATATRPWAPRRPLRSPRSDPARRLMNHARSMPPPRQARSPARRPARPVRCARRAATATATAGWGAEAATPTRPPRRSRGHGGPRKGGGGRPGLAGRLGVGRARPEGASGGGRQRAGRGLVAAPATPPSGAGGVGAARLRLAELPAPRRGALCVPRSRRCSLVSDEQLFWAALCARLGARPGRYLGIDCDSAQPWIPHHLTCVCVCVMNILIIHRLRYFPKQQDLDSKHTLASKTPLKNLSFFPFPSFVDLNCFPLKKNKGGGGRGSGAQGLPDLGRGGRGGQRKLPQ